MNTAKAKPYITTAARTLAPHRKTLVSMNLGLLCSPIQPPLFASFFINISQYHVTPLATSKRCGRPLISEPAARDSGKKRHL
jgi:hypothetical protein